MVFPNSSITPGDQSPDNLDRILLESHKSSSHQKHPRDANLPPIPGEDLVSLKVHQHARVFIWHKAYGGDAAVSS
jgi:hypothetical protein